MSAERRREFAEIISGFLADRGMSRSAARILGWLLVSDPARQTAGDICSGLDVSKASVSVGTQQLCLLGLVERSVAPGRRATAFEVSPWAFVRTALDPTPYRQLRELMDQGLGLMAGEDGADLSRVRIAREFYAVVEEKLPGFSALVEDEVARRLEEQGRSAHGDRR